MIRVTNQGFGRHQFEIDPISWLRQSDVIYSIDFEIPVICRIQTVSVGRRKKIAQAVGHLIRLAITIHPNSGITARGIDLIQLVRVKKKVRPIRLDNRHNTGAPDIPLDL
ncbi:hypothetical protein D3C72_1495860 [compost metagenome]